jgi:hypothetical protein
MLGTTMFGFAGALQQDADRMKTGGHRPEAIS